MSMWSRVKSLIGGMGKADADKTLASAATLNVPDDSNLWYLSGTTSITSLVIAPSTRDRSVTFIGAAGASVTFTNTNAPTTSGQMYLHGVDQVIQADNALTLLCKRDGTWTMLSPVV